MFYRTEAVERGMMLRTKAMREKEELREMKMYKYAIIRVRFPDGVLLQVGNYVFSSLLPTYDFCFILSVKVDLFQTCLI